MKNHLIFALSLLPLGAFCASEQPLPNDWRFLRIDPGVAEPEVHGAGVDSSHWEPVTVPHTVRVEAPESSYAPFLGIAWYSRTITADPAWTGKRVSLFFEGAMQVAEVWVNGEKVMKHEGGYLPFVVDLTAALKKSGKAVVTLRLNNGHQPLIPPGKPNKGIDFCYFGGLYRKVTLRVSDPLHVTDAVTAGKVAGGGVFARYENISETSADVLVSAEVKNDGASASAARVRFTLKDPSGTVVGGAENDAGSLAPDADATVRARFTVKSPKLWSPETPALYTLVTEILRDGRAVDTTATRIGIRSVAFTDEGFLLNGKPYMIWGANRHQDYPWLGNAMPDNASYRDLRILKEGGFNFLRLAHYPQSEAVMRAADELGLMVMVCTPGWQYYSKNPVFLDHARQNIREMIRWQRNHPSAVMWEVSLNETPGHEAFYAECARIAHEEYPGDQMLASGDTAEVKNADYLEVPYPVWNHSIGHNIANPTAKVKRAFVRECGDYNFGGRYSTSRVPYGAPEEALLLQAWNHQWTSNWSRAQPWFGGDAVWAGMDDASGLGNKDMPVSTWGPVSYSRLPKFSYEFYRSQRSPRSPGVGGGPMVSIANFWTPREGAGKVVVYSNCDEVELLLDGRSLGRRKPDSGPDSKYGEWQPDADPAYMVNGGVEADDAKRIAAALAARQAAEKASGKKRERVMFDGGNARHLPHAPFTFPNTVFAPGELKAVGYLDGKAVSEFSRRTPGKAVALRIEPSENGRPLAPGSDAMFFRACLVDAAGTIVRTTGTAVAFEVAGAGRAVSAPVVKSENGVASVLVASAAKPGKLRIVARAEGLPAATFEYEVAGRTE